MTNKTWMAVVVGLGFAAAAGCKGKDKQAAPTAGSATGSASGSAAAGSAAPGSAAAGSATATTTPPASAASMAAGEVKPVCFAWSASKQAAACIVGMSGLGVEAELSLAVVGGNASKVKLEIQPPPGEAAPGALPHLTSAGAKTVNEVLARDGFEPLAGAAQPVEDNPVELSGVTFALTSIETAKGGDNQPPTTKFTLTAKCGTDQFVATEEREGLDVYVRVRATGADFIVIDLHGHVAREGESSNYYKAAVLAVQGCKAFTGE